MKPKVRIVTAKCCQSSSLYGIRFEQKHPEHQCWVAVSSFAINESTAKKYRKYGELILGTFLTDESYPGCPFCKNDWFTECGHCRQIFCISNTNTAIHVICPFCEIRNRNGVFDPTLNDNRCLTSPTIAYLIGAPDI